MAKIHRFIGDFDLSRPAGLDKKELELADDTARQIIRVLKLKIGEKIELCDGKGIYAIAEIAEIRKKTVLVKIATPLHQGFVGQDSTKKVNLFCAILKKENFEMVVQKTTECGVSKIIPIISARTIKTGLNLERLQKIAREASEQSGRITIPEILEPISFEESLKSIDKNECNLLFDGSGKFLWSEELFYKIHCAGRRAEHSNSPAGEYARILESNCSRNIWIGPEGGWTPEEIEKAKNLNFKIASLGPLTLRAETAAIVATYLLVN